MRIRSRAPQNELRAAQNSLRAARNKLGAARNIPFASAEYSFWLLTVFVRLITELFTVASLVAKAARWGCCTRGVRSLGRAARQFRSAGVTVSACRPMLKNNAAAAGTLRQ